MSLWLMNRYETDCVSKVISVDLWPRYRSMRIMTGQMNVSAHQMCKRVVICSTADKTARNIGHCAAFLDKPLYNVLYFMTSSNFIWLSKIFHFQTFSFHNTRNKLWTVIPYHKTHDFTTKNYFSKDFTFELFSSVKVLTNF